MFYWSSTVWHICVRSLNETQESPPWNRPKIFFNLLFGDKKHVLQYNFCDLTFLWSTYFLYLQNRNSSDSDSIFTYKMGADENVSSAANRHSSHSSHSNNSTHSNQNQEIQSSSAKANGVKNDLKKYLQNYILFSSLEIESEKNFRDDQLNYLLKVSFLFESMFYIFVKFY